MKTKIVFLIVVLFIFSVGLFCAYRLYTNYKRHIKDRHILLEKRKQEWPKLRKDIKDKVDHFKGTVGVVIEDLNTGWEIDFNKEIPLPSASLVKVPIMLTCFYAAQDKKISLKDTIKIRPSERVSGSKVLGAQPAGAAFTIEGLLRPMITESDNTAANALIDLLGFDTLNTYFTKIGLKNTNIARKMMDFEERKEGVENYTTAQDMAYILKRLYHKDFLDEAVSEKCIEILAQQKINDRIPRKIPKNKVIVAHKTGLERHICHDAGIVFTPNGDFIICVLINYEDRFAKPAKKLISEMASLTYNYYQNF